MYYLYYDVQINQSLYCPITTLENEWSYLQFVSFSRTSTILPFILSDGAGICVLFQQNQQMYLRLNINLF
jgi:hypothetical protein